jgi:4-azaleucine resistance transporter AzlC
VTGPASGRRRLILDSLGISLSAGAFALVYGLAARNAGYSPIEAVATSIIVLAGASQFTAVGLVASGVPWAAIVLLTALLNARHLLYSAALAPWLAGRSRLERAAMAHTLTDETFALVYAHFRRWGEADVRGYWIASAFVCLPWIALTLVGVYGGAAVPDPSTLALDVVFPAAMAGLAVGVARGRPAVIAALVGATVAVSVALVTDPSVGIVVGGLVGPVAGMVLGGDRRPDVLPTTPTDEYAGLLP